MASQKDKKEVTAVLFGNCDGKTTLFHNLLGKDHSIINHCSPDPGTMTPACKTVQSKEVTVKIIDTPPIIGNLEYTQLFDIVEEIKRSCYTSTVEVIVFCASVIPGSHINKKKKNIANLAQIFWQASLETLHNCIYLQQYSTSSHKYSS